MKPRILLLVVCAACGVLAAGALGGRSTATSPGADATVVATELPLARFQAGDGQASCPTGSRVVGGGVSADNDPDAFWVRQSGPLDPSGVFASTNTGDVAVSWFADVANNTASNLLVKIFAICSASTDALVVAAPFDAPGHGMSVGNPRCPAGSRALGGGVGETVVGSSALEYVQRSGPLNDSFSFAGTSSGDYASSWYVAVYNGGAAQRAFKAFAICSASSDATLAAASVAVAPGQGGGALASCPSGSRALGGGIGSDGGDEPPDYVKVSGPRRAGGVGDDIRTGDPAAGWYASFHNGGGSTRDVKVFAICAKAALPATTSAPTMTARSTTTTTTTSAAATTTGATTTTTTTTAAPSTARPAKLVARLAAVSVAGHRAARSLRVTLRVSVGARAQLQLLRRGFERAQVLVRLTPGSNRLRLPLPVGLELGEYRLVITIRAGNQRATTSALVLLEASR